MSQYEIFYQLHHQPKPLIIANAWNVKSAQTIEQCGYDAIATSSGAIASALGYADGEQIPFEEMLYIVKRITATAKIPVSVDLERGYSNELHQLNDHIRQLIDAGVVGINLEDAQGEPVYLEKLYSVKNYLVKNNLSLFINARTDGFLQKLEAPLQTTIRRAKLYKEAGADGLFVTAVQDVAVIKEITFSTTLPVNIVATPALPNLQTLADCGVSRISMAVMLYKSTYRHLESVLSAVRSENSFAPMF